jgi:thiamine biosynthesis protein ThiS
MARDAKFEITLNGEPCTLDGDARLATLLERLKVRRTRVAVELNREIVPKSEYDRVMLKPGDQLEVINFVGGG